MHVCVQTNPTYIAQQQAFVSSTLAASNATYNLVVVSNSTSSPFLYGSPILHANSRGPAPQALGGRITLTSYLRSLMCMPDAFCWCPVAASVPSQVMKIHLQGHYPIYAQPPSTERTQTPTQATTTAGPM